MKETQEGINSPKSEGTEPIFPAPKLIIGSYFVMTHSFVDSKSLFYFWSVNS